MTERIFATSPAKQHDTLESRAKALSWFAWLCLAIAFILATYVIFHSYRFSLNSDGAVEDVLARLAIQEGRLVPTNFTYANGDLWILGPRLFLVIALPWVGFGYLLHASATWIAYVYLLLMVYGTCRVLTPRDRLSAVMATTLAAGCFSALNFEFAVGQGAYSLYAALALGMYGLVATNGGEPARPHSSKSTLLLAGTAATMVCISNATRGGITVIAPLAAGWTASVLLLSTGSWRVRIRALNNDILLSILAGAIAGTLLYKYWLLPEITNSTGAASFVLTPTHEMWQRILTLPAAWLAYFRIDGGWAGQTLPLRIAQIMAWLLAVLLVVSPVWVILTFKRHSRPLVTMSCIALACYAVTFAALVASQRLYDGAASMRYGTFAIYASACVLAALIADARFRFPRSAAGFGALLCLGSIATISSWHTQPSPGGITYSEQAALIDSLTDKHVNTVLATYWNAEVLDVISAGTIAALPVGMNDSSGLWRYAQNSPRVSDPYHAEFKQAVALTTAEATRATWSAISDQIGKPNQRYRSGPFEVWVYDGNIAAFFFGNKVLASNIVPANQLEVELSRTSLPTCQSAPTCTFTIEATNTGQHILASSGPNPIRLGIQGVDTNGKVVEWDAGRADFRHPLIAGSSERVTVSLSSLSNPQVAGYKLCLLQELVAWHCNRTKPARTSPPKAD